MTRLRTPRPLRNAFGVARKRAASPDMPERWYRLVYDMSGCDVIELRRYALYPGARDTLIALFERVLVEPQEAVGMRVLGAFRDVDDPDSFVWIRGFANMAARGEGLQAFYGGPVWAAHRDAANATMIDSDNVFLLRPVDEESRLDLDASRPRAPRVASVTICPLGPGQGPAFARRFTEAIEPALRAAGAKVRARLVTEHAANNYPALPVREGEEVFVWLSLFADGRSRDEHVERSGLERLVAGQLAADMEVLRLEPTARSLLPD